jgi:hypothetical protein
LDPAAVTGTLIVPSVAAGDAATAPAGAAPVAACGVACGSAWCASPKLRPSAERWRNRSRIEAQLRLSPLAVSDAVPAEIASAAAGRARLNIEPPNAIRRPDAAVKRERYQLRFAEL